ncbi:hypothetical protein [Psychrobacter urativorans]|uniref:hypothetical protein n=1 Tax=Psychrobacter urativorans TaxID=45610 RepID=UPI0019184476|nr:hypothetical protein [Psychrobacter urativorans]
MFTNNYSTLWRSCLSLLGLSVTLALTGCNNMPSISAPDTPPIHTQTTNNQASSDKKLTKCPPFNPEQTMCTAQYDPVCVKVKNHTGVSYRTAGNACSACGTTSAISYVKGQCS